MSDANRLRDALEDPQFERKNIPFGRAGIKFASTPRKFDGYGAYFSNVDAYGDVIDPGAFAQYLSDANAGKQPWPAMLENHGGWGMGSRDRTPIGAWDDLSEDGKGLKSDGQLADIERGRDIYTLMKMEPRPAIDGLSIGYIAKESVPRSSPDEPRRRIKRIDLVEISVVTFPANRLARVGSVKGIDQLSTITDVEDFLREAGGFSRGEAKALVARIKTANPREAGGEISELVDAAVKAARAFC